MRSSGNCGNGRVEEVHEPRQGISHAKPGATPVRAVALKRGHRKNCACPDCRRFRRLNQSIEARRMMNERMGRAS